MTPRSPAGRGAPVKPASSAGSTPAGGTPRRWLHEQRTLADAHTQASRKWRRLGEEAHAESIRLLLAGDVDQGHDYYLTEVRCHLNAGGHAGKAAMMRRRADRIEQGDAG